MRTLEHIEASKLFLEIDDHRETFFKNMLSDATVWVKEYEVFEQSLGPYSETMRKLDDMKKRISEIERKKGRIGGEGALSSRDREQENNVRDFARGLF